MLRARFGLLIAAALLVGCAVTIPPKIEVKDVASGKTYTTYKPWGEVKAGVGYTFTDIATGETITLTSYELKTLSENQSVDPKSPTAKQYEELVKKYGK